MEIANLDVEIRDKTAEIEDAEDEETVARLTAEIEQLKDRKQKLKERAREEDRKAKAIKQAGQFKLTSENVLSQEWHDSRYYGARKAGVKDEEYQNDILEGVETEGVEDIGGGKVRVLTGDARVAKKSQLRQADQTKFVQAARRYRSLTQAEVSRFKVETKEDEAKVMEKKRVNLFAKRLRHMTPQKKLERKQRVAAAKKRRTVCRSMVWHGKCKDGDKCKFDHDVAKYEKANLCPQFIHGHCRQLTKCKMNHDAVEREICRILKRQKKVKRKKSEAQTGQKGASRTSGPADSDSGGSAMEQEDAKSTVRLIEAKDVKSTVRLVEAKDVKDPSSFEAPYAEQGEWISMNFDTGAAVTAIPKKLSDYLELKGDPNSSSYKTASGELLPDEGGAVMRGYTNDCCGRSIEGRLVDVHRLLVSGSAVSKKNVVILDGNEGWIIPRDSKIGKGVRATRDDLINQNYKEAKMITKMYERKGIFLFDLWMDKHTKMNGVDAKELGAVQGEESAEGEGGRKPKLLRSPVTMTVDEIEEHETQATIHRTWCGHCMRARGLHERHASEAQKGKDERGLPIISMDYFWMGKDSKNRDVPDPEGELPSLQIKDEHTGFVWASVVPAKGADLYAVNFAIQSVEESGYRRIVLKSDNESSIKALKSAIKEGIKSVEIVMEEGKTGDSQSNGSCEVAVRETKRQVRAMKSALEEKMGLKIHSWKRPSVTFGRVWFKPRSYVRLAYDTMREGLFLGAHGRNGDALTEGVKGGSVKRVPDETKFDQMCGTPWKMRPKRPEDLVAPAVALPAVPEGVRLMPEPSDKGSGQVRNLYVKKADVEGNFTPGCDGCNAIVGLPARSHSVECRTLVEQRLMETEEGRDCVMRARKRKADAAGKEDKSGDVVVPAIEGMPDMEEVAASAVGDRWKILRKAFTELSPRTEGDVALESAMQEREAGIKKELMNAGEISELSSITAGPSPDETSSEPTESFFDPDVQTEGVFFESVTGTPLKTEKVWEARREEMTWVKKQDLYEVVDEQVSKSGQPLKLRLIDISRAHFGQARRRVFCNLGEEIPGKCALLKRSMYGTLDAASIWQHTYADVLKNNIKQCNAWPALFYQEDSDLRFMVHGDDFISLGDDFAQNFLEKVLSEKFEYRVDGQIGPEAADGTAMCVLNRVLEFNKDTGILTYADPRNAEDIIRALNLEESKSVSTPAEKQKLTDVSLTMRAAYLSMDRADLSEAVKSLARHMTEFYALVKAGAMGLGLQAMLDEWQIPT
ncbi:unnamed protein product, partial [Effrenium voratum]